MSTKTYDELYALITQRGVHAEFGEPGEGWGIEQNPHELATFLCRMQELGVTSCLEIGTGYKGGLSRFLAADMGWRVITIDIENYGHKYEGVLYVYPPLSLDYLEVDLLFIDGNHSLEAVRYDFEQYRMWATKAVAFHDIAGLRDCGGVKQFWFELAFIHVMPKDHRIKPNYHEVIADEKSAGIGWIEL